MTTTDTDLDREERRLQARLDANLTAAEAALKEATKSPTVTGSQGQARPHPGFGIAAQCDELAMRLHARLTELRERREKDAELAAARELTTVKLR